MKVSFSLSCSALEIALLATSGSKEDWYLYKRNAEDRLPRFNFVHLNITTDLL